jgi:hypothetical protein
MVSQKPRQVRTAAPTSTWVVLASLEELARISKVSGVADGNEGSGVVEVKDAVE